MNWLKKFLKVDPEQGKIDFPVEKVTQKQIKKVLAGKRQIVCDDFGNVFYFRIKPMYIGKEVTEESLEIGRLPIFNARAKYAR